MSAPTPAAVYLEAYYPRTSPAFLLVWAIFFGAVAVAMLFFLPIAALIAGVITLYLAKTALRQAYGSYLGVRITDRALFHRGWQSRWYRRGFPNGEVPLAVIAGSDVMLVRSGAGTAPFLALWLSDPSHYRLGKGIRQFVDRMVSAGDLAIDCDELDQSAEQIKAALDAALADLQNNCP